MAHAFAIYKTISFRGNQEEFANVYHYTAGLDALPASEQGWRDMALQIAANEKVFHSSGVQFKRYVVWGPTQGSKAQSQIIVDGPLTGAGSVLSGTAIPAEACVVAEWYLGRNVRGRRNRFLRKYYHVGMLPTSGQTNAANEGSQIATADLATLKTQIQTMREIVVGGQTWALTSPKENGTASGKDTQILQYLRMHQLRVSN